MLIVRKNEVNNLIATVSMNKTLPNPYYLFSFQHIASKDRVSFIPQVITSNCRYDKFRFREGGNNNPSLVPPEVYFPYLGQYYYSIYEQISPTNTNIALAYNKLESGRAVIIVDESQPQECFFEPYISNDEDFSNIIYVSEEEDICISGDTQPVCPPELTGVCPTYLTRYSPINSIYYKNTGTTASFLSSLNTCAPVQVAFDDTRMFMVDGCSNYYQYDYTITSGGCFNLTLVDSWRVWASSAATPNASYSLGIYDQNNLIIGESASFEFQTGSTLYLYNLTTSGLTKWLEIGNNAQVYNIYYNTGNTQTVLSYGSASGGTGYYQLYSGSTNPQLVSQFAGTFSNAGSTMYFSGNTPVAVNAAGLQFPLNFTAGTMSLLENSSGIPIYYVDFEDGFGYLSNISQPASCYTFDIQPFPISPTPTPSMTTTPTLTPTNTPTLTPTMTPSATPPSDTDANLYLSAVVEAGGSGITPSVSAATTNLFINLKSAGLYNKIYALYPMLGGIAGSCKFNAVNPVDNNAAHRLTFGGGGTFSQSVGYKTNGINSFANTHFNPNNEAVPYTSFTMFDYVSVDGNAGYDIGGAASSIFVGMASRNVGQFQGEIVVSNFGFSLGSASSALGANIVSRFNSTSSLSTVNNGGPMISVPQNTLFTSMPSINMLIGVYAGVGFHSDKGLSTVGLAEGLTQTEVVNLRDIITAFNTTIGR